MYGPAPNHRRTVLRELLQNAADASASSVKIEFTTIPSATVPLPQSPTQASLVQHTILHHTLKRLVVTNDGQAFRESDWSRLKRIAEGNPDETKIGAFGVGFYSVFSDCEEPFVSSGGDAMAFYWKGNSLFTRRSKLNKEQASPDTAFVLDYRNTTSPIPPLLSLAQFLSSSLTFVNLSEIELWIDNWKLLSLTKLAAPGYAVEIPRGLNTKTNEGLMRISSVIRETVQMEAKWLNIVGWKPKAPESNGKSTPPAPTLRTFFSRFSNSGNNSSAAAKAAKEERAAQEALLSDLMGEKRAVAFLQVSTATISTSVSKSFGQELERATKKPAPKTTKLAVLTATLEASGSDSPDNDPLQSNAIFASVLPSKSGRIYIGFPTHSTTGLAAHVSAPSIIPTVERESIDLNARWVKTWNQEMLRATGILCRIAWTASITSLREGLTRSMTIAGRGNIATSDVENVAPQCIDLLNQFTFYESTPSAQVGNLIEEAFWTCNSSSSIEILSSRGILASQHVRIATDELSFVNGIPVVPSSVFKEAHGFVQRLVDYGIITEITTGDIRKELENQALNTKQAHEFLQWLSHKARVNELDLPAIKALMEVTVINDEEDHRIIALGQITHFLNPARIPGHMPLPETVLPFKLTKAYERQDLERLGWTDLQIVPWLRFLIENIGGRGNLKKSEDLLHSPDFASSVLAVVSKQWDGLSQSSRATVTDLLGTRTTMPTKQGMRTPSTAYFPSVKLFDDLPTVTVHAVKDKFLVALGVRKTIELDLIFQRLLTPEKTSLSPAWSHVELIKYLASVQKDIPKADIAKLHKTATCSAEGSDPNKQQRYRVCDLFQPNDNIRSLGLPVLQWSGVFRENSEEGQFLKLLNIRTYPTEVELIRIIVTAHANQDLPLRETALRYLTEFFHQHGYSTAAIVDTRAAFLPVNGQPKKLALPSTCFTNERATAMGFDVLRKDLEQHATKLGVVTNPPIQDCVLWLIKNKPQSHRDARQLFDMFASRLNELRGPPLQTLSEAEIVPVAVRAATVSEKGSSKSIKHVAPTYCFLGSGDSKYADIFDYVDFGSEADSFLLRCGSKHEPTTAELAIIVVREPARIFNVFGSPERYLDLMMTLARSWSSLKKDKKLVRDMKHSAFLLASTEFPAENVKRKSTEVDDIYDEDDATIKTYQLAQPEKITIADDVINYNLFKGNVLTAPPFEELESFYASLGAIPLSSIVEERPRVGSTLADQRPATHLQRLVQERIKLLFHDISADQIRHDASWLEKNLSFVAVSSISVRKTLVGRNLSHVEDTTAIELNHPRLGMTIFFTPGTRDFFNVSQALLHICLHRPKPQQALILTTLLETDLLKLRARGYDVSRILRKKAHEARIAEEQRQEQLKEEQKRIQEAQVVARHQQTLQVPPDQDPVSMPGHFPDTSHNDDSKTPISAPENEGRTPRGLFSSLTRSLGMSNSPQQPAPQLPPIEVGTQPLVLGDRVETPEPVTSPADLHQNLLSAIQASRPHNSTSVMTDPAVNEVRETHSFCDAKPKQDIEFVGEATPGIKIFLPHALADKQRFMSANASAINAFANILLSVAETLRLPRQSLHIFFDEHSKTIAFNSNRALFFNYKYFETLHLPEVQQGRTAAALGYWGVTTCHELAHNLVADHSSAHTFYT